MALLDTYELKARLSPGFLAILPIAFSGATLGLEQYPAIAIGGGLLTAAGATYLLSVIAAHFGRRDQERLWKRWGGRPTTQLLRYHDGAVNPTQRDIWRKALEAVTGVGLLSESAEAADPRTAQEAIEASSDQVRYLAQDRRFTTLASENAQYGFERNLLGLRWVGRGVSLGCLIGLLLVLIVRPLPVSSAAVAVGMLIDVTCFICWISIPSEQRTKAAAFRYGNQLLQAVVRTARSSIEPSIDKEGSE